MTKGAEHELEFEAPARYESLEFAVEGYFIRNGERHNTAYGILIDNVAGSLVKDIKGRGGEASNGGVTSLGMRLTSSGNFTIENITFNDWNTAFSLISSTNNITIRNSLGNASTSAGVLMTSSTSISIINGTFNYNDIGVSVGSGATNNVFRNITASNNRVGVRILQTASTNEFSDLIANNNTENGIEIATAVTVPSNINFTRFRINASVQSAIFYSSGLGTSTGIIFTNGTITSTNASYWDLNRKSSSTNDDEVAFVDTPIARYNISAPGFLATFSSASFTEIKFLKDINGTGTNLSNDIRIANNSAFVNDTISGGGLNKTANITFYGLSTGFTSPEMKRNDAACASAICKNFTSLNAGTVVINVTGWSNYSIGETAAANSAPNNPSVSINSTTGTNKTLLDLNCYATITDPDANNRLNVTVRWYNNSIQHLTFDYNNSYSNGTLFIALLDDLNTTRGQNWTCGMRLFDNALYSSLVNSSNVTILNTLPTITSTSPADGTSTTNRTPALSFGVNDADSDPLTYDLNITLIAASTCSESARDFKGAIAGGATSAEQVVTPELKCFYDELDYYNWTVIVNDSEGVSNRPTANRINISSLITLSLPNSTINFGTLIYPNSNDTADDSPLPFLIQNDGNSLTNITIRSTDLWKSVANPNAFYRFKADNNTLENNSFNWALSTNTYTNIPAFASPQICIALINHTDVTDSAQIDIYVEVPSNEGPGARNSSITFTGSFAE